MKRYNELSPVLLFLASGVMGATVVTTITSLNAESFSGVIISLTTLILMWVAATNYVMVIDGHISALHRRLKSQVRKETKDRRQD